MATDKTYTAKTIGPELRRVAKRLGKATVRAMWTAAHLGRTRAVVAIGEVKPYQPVDTGQMKRSYMITRITNGAVLENVAPHAVFMEHGTRPFTPPRAPLIAWAERKMRRAPKKRKKKGGRGKRGPTKAASLAARKAAAKSFGMAVWAKIRKRGIEGRGFHRAAMQFAAGDTEKALLKALRKGTR